MMLQTPSKPLPSSHKYYYQVVNPVQQRPSLSKSVYQHECRWSCASLASHRLGCMKPHSTQSASQSQQIGKCNIICSVIGPDYDSACQQLQSATAGGADIIEVRIDCLSDASQDQIDQIIKKSDKPVIVTNRAGWEGGNNSDPEDKRLRVLSELADSGATYIDIEYKALEQFKKSHPDQVQNYKLVVSYHDFDQTPPLSELQTIIDSMWKEGAYIAKIATMANDISDCSVHWSILSQQQGPTIALAMGAAGVPTRLLANKQGAFGTFAAIEQGKQSAPGQPVLQDMVGMYRFKEHKEGWGVFGICGNPVGHSKSPLIHNMAMERVGHDGVFVPFLVQDMNTFMDAFKLIDVQGLCVTIPHKEAALALSDEQDPLADSIGAANTLIRQQKGKYKCYNTDCIAAIDAVEQGMRKAGVGGNYESGRGWEGVRVVVLGAGGAGRALAFGAADRGGTVLIANRSRGRADALARDIPNARAVDLADVASGKESGEVLINTTSVGMDPNVTDTPVPREVAQKFSVAFDAIYTPLETQLLKDAKSGGAEVVSGLEMFVGQAAEQFKLFTGVDAPVDAMRQIVLDKMKI